MKKSVILLAALMPFIMFSCKDPDNGKREQGSTEIAGSSGKTLVKKMTVRGKLVDHWFGDEEGYYDYYSSKRSRTLDAILTFTYADGLMSRISGSGTCASVEDEEWSDDGETGKFHGENNFSGKGNIAFTYKNDVVNVAVTAQGNSSGKEVYTPDPYDENEEWSNEGSISGDYILNMENGMAVSGQGTFRIEDGTSTTDKVKFEYDVNNQLKRIYYEGDYGSITEFKWENGNMVQVGWYDDEYKSDRKHSAKRFFAPRKAKATKAGIAWEDECRVEYSSKENKSNLDFASIIFTCYIGSFSEQVIGVFGFAGKESKNLPSKIYEMGEEWNAGECEEVEKLILSIEYDFNGDGTVKRIKLSSPVYDEEDGYDTATATIDLEY